MKKFVYLMKIQYCIYIAYNNNKKYLKFEFEVVKKYL
jgi:hypothetical protein